MMTLLIRNFQKLLEFTVTRGEEKRQNTFKNLAPQIFLGLGVLSTVYFLLSEAERFVESSEVFFPFATRVVNLYGITVLICCGPRID